MSRTQDYCRSTSLSYVTSSAREKLATDCNGHPTNVIDTFYQRSNDPSTDVNWYVCASRTCSLEGEQPAWQYSSGSQKWSCECTKNVYAPAVYRTDLEVFCLTKAAVSNSVDALAFRASDLFAAQLGTVSNNWDWVFTYPGNYMVPRLATYAQACLTNEDATKSCEYYKQHNKGCFSTIAYEYMHCKTMDAYDVAYSPSHESYWPPPPWCNQFMDASFNCAVYGYDAKKLSDCRIAALNADMAKSENFENMMALGKNNIFSQFNRTEADVEQIQEELLQFYALANSTMEIDEAFKERAISFLTQYQAKLQRLANYFSASAESAQRLQELKGLLFEDILAKDRELMASTEALQATSQPIADAIMLNSRNNNETLTFLRTRVGILSALSQDHLGLARSFMDMLKQLIIPTDRARLLAASFAMQYNLLAMSSDTQDHSGSGWRLFSDHPPVMPRGYVVEKYDDGKTAATDNMMVDRIRVVYSIPSTAVDGHNMFVQDTYSIYAHPNFLMKMTPADVSIYDMQEFMLQYPCNSTELQQWAETDTQRYCWGWISKSTHRMDTASGNLLPSLAQFIAANGTTGDGSNLRAFRSQDTEQEVDDTWCTDIDSSHPCLLFTLKDLNRALHDNCSSMIPGSPFYVKSAVTGDLKIWTAPDASADPDTKCATDLIGMQNEDSKLIFSLFANMAMGMKARYMQRRAAWGREVYGSLPSNITTYNVPYQYGEDGGSVMTSDVAIGIAHAGGLQRVRQLKRIPVEPRVDITMHGMGQPLTDLNYAITYRSIIDTSPYSNSLPPLFEWYGDPKCAVADPSDTSQDCWNGYPGLRTIFNTPNAISSTGLNANSRYNKLTCVMRFAQFFSNYTSPYISPEEYLLTSGGREFIPQKCAVDLGRYLTVVKRDAGGFVVCDSDQHNYEGNDHKCGYLSQHLWDPFTNDKQWTFYERSWTRSFHIRINMRLAFNVSRIPPHTETTCPPASAIRHYVKGGTSSQIMIVNTDPTSELSFVMSYTPSSDELAAELNCSAPHDDEVVRLSSRKAKIIILPECARGGVTWTVKFLRNDDSEYVCVQLLDLPSSVATNWGAWQTTLQEAQRNNPGNWTLQFVNSTDTIAGRTIAPVVNLAVIEQQQRARVSNVIDRTIQQIGSEVMARAQKFADSYQAAKQAGHSINLDELKQVLKQESDKTRTEQDQRLLQLIQFISASDADTRKGLESMNAEIRHFNETVARTARVVNWLIEFSQNATRIREQYRLQFDAGMSNLTDAHARTQYFGDLFRRGYAFLQAGLANAGNELDRSNFWGTYKVLHKITYSFSDFTDDLRDLWTHVNPFSDDCDDGAWSVLHYSCWWEWLKYIFWIIVMIIIVCVCIWLAPKCMSCIACCYDAMASKGDDSEL